jgi:hypothetical protein
VQRRLLSRNFVDYSSSLRPSATNSEADTEPEGECHAKPYRVNEWNESRSRLGDLKRPDRAGAHASTASTSGSISRGLRAPALSTTGPKAVADAGDWDHRPSTGIDGFAIHISYARANSQMIAKRAQHFGNLHSPILRAWSAIKTALIRSLSRR